MKKYIIFFISLFPVFCFGQIPCEELNATGTSTGLNFSSEFDGQIDSWISYDYSGLIIGQSDGNDHSVSLVNENGTFGIESFMSSIHWDSNVCHLFFTWNGLTWAGSPIEDPFSWPLSMESNHLQDNKKVIKRYDFFGNQIIGEPKTPFIKVYDDGSVEKILIIKK